MGETDIQSLTTLITSHFTMLGNSIDATNNAVAQSRLERDTQMREIRGDIGALRNDVQSVSLNGCAHRAAHEENYRRTCDELAELRAAMARQKRASADKPPGVFTDFFGTLGTTKWRATGLAAILLALAVGYGIMRYGYKLLDEVPAKPAVTVSK